MARDARAGNKPPHILRPGSIDRHEALSIHQGTKAKGKTSILHPGLSMAEDIAAINEGLAERLPNNRYRINGRVYIDKGTGETFPEWGVGVWEFSRSQLGLLKVMLKQEGWNDISASKWRRAISMQEIPRLQKSKPCSRSSGSSANTSHDHVYDSLHRTSHSTSRARGGPGTSD